MKNNVTAYVSAFLFYQRAKYDRGKPKGLILERPWKHITMDFIFGVPKTNQGHDMIWNSESFQQANPFHSLWKATQSA